VEPRLATRGALFYDRSRFPCGNRGARQRDELRIPVATVVSLVAEGQTTEQILSMYPDLEIDDVREALLFAAEAVRERTLPLAAGE